MKREIMYDVIIIGAGPAGISAALWCHRLGLSVLVLEQGEKIGGQLHHIHNRIIDYPGIIVDNGEQLIARFRDHLDTIGVTVLTDQYVSSLFLQQDATICTETKQKMYYSKTIIIASGTKERRLQIPGEQEMLEKMKNSSSNKDLKQFAGKNVLVVGGGDRAFEGACNIAGVAASVTLIHRGTQFRARSEFVHALQQCNNVTILTSTIIEKLQHRNNMELATLVHTDQTQRLSQEEAFDAILIRIGREPVDHFVPDTIQRTSDRLIYVDSNGRTSCKLIYAIGDLVNQAPYSSISTAVGQGMRAARAIAEELK